MKSIAIAVCLLAALGASEVFSQSQGGSLDFSDVKELLNQQPLIARFITESLEVRHVGDAARIGYGDNPVLAGIRVSPFSFDAKVKGSRAGYDLSLVIEAKVEYFDENGKPTDLRRAKALKQVLQRIVLKANATGASDPTAQSPDKRFFAATRRVPDPDYIWKRDLDRFRLVVFRQKSDDELGDVFAKHEGGPRLVDKQLWSPDSKFFVLSTASSGGHSPWHFDTCVFSVADQTLRRMDDLVGPITDPQFHFEPPDTVVVRVRDYTHEFGDPGDSKTVKVVLHDAFGKMAKVQ
ncbi:hypothetical protein IT570_12325 [Candidatus Sumerlaeota bacterium]|nr:hypothetical protein [Candidatus Sumerlaeota bacterium]